LSRVEALAAKGPADAEAALAVARAALDAQEFAAARSALAPYTALPHKRVAALMAELEMAQGDEGRGREWMARALNARREPAGARGGARARPRVAGPAGEQAARRFGVEGSARRRGPWHRDRAPRRGSAGGAGHARGSCHARDRAASANPAACERREGESAA